MKRLKIFNLCTGFFAFAAFFALSAKSVFAGGQVPEEITPFFDSAVPLLESIIGLLTALVNVIVSIFTGIYNQYSYVGVILGIVVIIIAICLIAYVWKHIRRFIKFIFRSIKKGFLRMTGLDKKQKEKIDKYRKEKLAEKRAKEDLMRFNNAEKQKATAPNWEEEVQAEVDKLLESGEMVDEVDDSFWQSMVSGTFPYSEKLTELEKIIFTTEDKIHDLVEKIATIPREQILIEMAKLRIEFKVLDKNLDYLKQLQETFPDDPDIASLLELANAFLLATKNVEKGFVAALTK
ncbi:MAG: hypothetical protein FWG64_11785 [Firmicutes bacterium]|nr:hypothetical protein [Bacillota bacterium]